MSNHRRFRGIVVLSVALLGVAPWAVAPVAVADIPAPEATRSEPAGSIAPLEGLPFPGPAALRSALDGLLGGAFRGDGGKTDADGVPPSRIAHHPSIAVIPPGVTAPAAPGPRPSQALLKRRSASGEADLPPPLS